MKFTNLRIGTRLGAGFALVLLLLILVALLGVSRMAQMKDRLEEITKINNAESALAGAMRRTVYDRMIALRNLALLTEASEMQPEVERIKVQTKMYAEAEEKLTRMFNEEAGTLAEEKAALQRIREAAVPYLPLQEKVQSLGLANKAEEATQVLIKEVRPVQRKWMEALGDLIELEEKLNEQALIEAERAYSSARTLMLVLSALALAAGAAIAWLITRSITRPVGIAVAVARTVASGDLGSRIEVKSTDETGELLQALKDMNDSLVRIVTDVRGSTETISTASSQIASGNLDLSSRTEQQAGSLEETASSMEELTSTVRQNADNALQANQLAQSASEVAQKGGAVVSQVVGTMSAINDSAKKIVDIISVIDGIAFQTNILALNAAVEAARAGEQGRGFAVVASEVRNLAQRSAAAAKEIKALISDSVEKVDVGAKLVDQAGTTMEEIVDSVKRVTDIMNEITAASREQASGIAQVNDAVTQMDQVTQQNAALVEEAAAAAQSLQDQASALAQVVSVFQLGNGMHAATAQTSAQVIAYPRPARPASPAALPARKPQARKIANALANDGGEWEQF